MQEILKACPELVEAVARALAKAEGFRAEDWRDCGYEKPARAAIRAITAWNQRIGR